jgi:hypothetical protein
MEIHNQIEVHAPDISYQRTHPTKSSPSRPIPHRESINRQYVVNVRTQLGDRRASMAGQQRQLGIWKFGFEGCQSWKKQNHIAKPREADSQNLHRITG